MSQSTNTGRLTPFASGVWLHHHVMKMVPGTALPCRSTIIEMAPGELLIVSPGPFSEDDAAAIRTLGAVRWLVAPNLFHHLHLRPAQDHFPSSQIAAPSGLAVKRKNLTTDADLATLDLGPNIQILAIDGEPGIQEYVVYHLPSKTLVVTDLLFNLKKPAGCLSPLLFGLMGTYNRLAASRLTKLLIKDSGAFRQSVRRLLDLDIDRLVMAHGDPVASDGKQALRSAIEVRFGPL